MLATFLIPAKLGSLKSSGSSLAQFASLGWQLAVVCHSLYLVSSLGEHVTPSSVTTLSPRCGTDHNKMHVWI